MIFNLSCKWFYFCGEICIINYYLFIKQFNKNVISVLSLSSICTECYQKSYYLESSLAKFLNLNFSKNLINLPSDN